MLQFGITGPRVISTASLGLRRDSVGFGFFRRIEDAVKRQAKSEHEEVPENSQAEKTQKPSDNLSTPVRKPTGSVRIIWETDPAHILIIGGIKK